ncbi:signal peptidase complex catalytic subunit SEC11 [Pseudohyphozyma bogoriensis]|nr:signal peptidase complex catalytic subunit SEC11 [Pseudohyphozyma bogoriensis]
MLLPYPLLTLFLFTTTLPAPTASLPIPTAFSLTSRIQHFLSLPKPPTVNLRIVDDHYAYWEPPESSDGDLDLDSDIDSESLFAAIATASVRAKALRAALEGIGAAAEEEGDLVIVEEESERDDAEDDVRLGGSGVRPPVRASVEGDREEEDDETLGDLLRDARAAVIKSGKKKDKSAGKKHSKKASKAAKVVSTRENGVGAPTAVKARGFLAGRANPTEV